MTALVQLYRKEQAVWDQKAAEHWAGDCVLADALHLLGIELSWSYPIIQGGDPDTMDFLEFGNNRHLWCYPVASYHHVKPGTIGALWYLTQDWITTHSTEPLRHGDVFKEWILPQMSHQQLDWDNLADLSVEGGQSCEDEWCCRVLCENNNTCVQYSYREKLCRTLGMPRLGVAKSDGSCSGWMMGRMHDLVKRLDKCDGEGHWVLPR